MLKTISLLKQHDELKIIDAPLDIELEIPHLAYLEVKKENGKALFFRNPIHKGKRFDIPVLMNVFGSFKRLELLSNSKVDKIAKDLNRLLDMSMPNDLLGKLDKFYEFLKDFRYTFVKNSKKVPPFKQLSKSLDDVNLFDLPILKTWEDDGGFFITMGQTYTMSVDGKYLNLGLYRLQVKSKNELIMHWQIHKDANHFFHEYKKANKLMPLSIAIGGDPISTWCAQAPMPPNVCELVLYGLIKKQNMIVSTCSNGIKVPFDSDIVLEGYVDTSNFAPEGKFGDHTGFYTPVQDFPVMEVKNIYMKKEPIFLATVVGKPPLEDKYMGAMTGGVFLPLMQRTTHGLVDYSMPENGVFHNLVLASLKLSYPAQSLQAMHAFFGLGQMSFAKHIVFFDESSGINLHGDYKKLTDFVLDRLIKDNLFITEGICDELDHASAKYCHSGKVGIDATGERLEFSFEVISQGELLQKVRDKLESRTCNNELKIAIKNLHIYKHSNPIIFISVDKINARVSCFYDELIDFNRYGNIFIFVDSNNILDNYYLLLWRVVNSIDISRDLEFRSVGDKDMIFLDATSKSSLENYTREWPKDVNCTASIIQSLKDKGLLEDINETFLKKYGILE